MGNLLIYSAEDDFCIWLRELPGCTVWPRPLSVGIYPHGSAPANMPAHYAERSLRRDPLASIFSLAVSRDSFSVWL
jgi:hypothetical protein